MRLKDYRNIDKDNCIVKYDNNQYQWYDVPMWMFELNVEKVEQIPYEDHTIFYLTDL